jgi:hypothetical protein
MSTRATSQTHVEADADSRSALSKHDDPGITPHGVNVEEVDLHPSALAFVVERVLRVDSYPSGAVCATTLGGSNSHESRAPRLPCTANNRVMSLMLRIGNTGNPHEVVVDAPTHRTTPVLSRRLALSVQNTQYKGLSSSPKRISIATARTCAEKGISPHASMLASSRLFLCGRHPRVCPDNAVSHPGDCGCAE